MRKLWIVTALLLVLMSLSATAETLKECKAKCLLGAKDNCYACCEERALNAGNKCGVAALKSLDACQVKAGKIKDEAKRKEALKDCDEQFKKEATPCFNNEDIDITKEKCKK
jgi:hypothetical protein